MRDIRKNPLIKKLLSLDLPENDYAIFGSAPLYFHGIIDEMRDLDVVARGKAWEKVRKLGRIERFSTGGYSVNLFDGDVEIVNDWIPGDWDKDNLIDEADIIDGIRVVTLENVFKWKKKMGRKKDKKHLDLIKSHQG